jgi:hypothetical protein
MFIVAEKVSRPKGETMEDKVEASKAKQRKRATIHLKWSVIQISSLQLVERPELCF